MKNIDKLVNNIEEGLSYIKEQQEKTRPLIDAMTIMLCNRVNEITEQDISFKELLSFYLTLMEQETNSILLITKMQEVLTYAKDVKKF